MANDNISYKKFTIQTIVNPGRFWVLGCGKETQTEPKQCISSKDIKRVTHFEQIYTGQMVAVKHENEFKRGLIIDIYNRCKKATYNVFLVDNGCSTEVASDSIFMIRTSELKNKKLNAFEILVHGIKPVTIELFVSSMDLDSSVGGDNEDGIFHKRTSNKWSPAAFKFVKNLFKKNSCIYVNCININGASITGDVYYEQEGFEGLRSLAQTLCDKDFALYSKNELKIEKFPEWEGNEHSSGMERRIATVPDTRDASWEE